MIRKKVVTRVIKTSRDLIRMIFSHCLTKKDLFNWLVGFVAVIRLSLMVWPGKQLEFRRFPCQTVKLSRIMATKSTSRMDTQLDILQWLLTFLIQITSFFQFGLLRIFSAVAESQRYNLFILAKKVHMSSHCFQLIKLFLIFCCDESSRYT